MSAKETEARKVYIPHIVDTPKDFSELKGVLKTKKEVIVITNAEFYNVFLKRMKKEIKHVTKLGTGFIKGAAAGAVAVVDAMLVTVAWPIIILAGIAAVSSLADIGISTVNVLFDGIKHYTPLLDDSHHYVYLFNNTKTGYQNGSPIDTSQIYGDTTQKVELRDPLTGEIRIANVNEISVSDHVW